MRRRPARVCAVLVVGVGIVGLFAQAVGARGLLAFGSGGAATMKANTALLFLLSGVALFLLASARGVGARAAGILLAVSVSAVAAATLLEDVGRFDLGIDQLLFRDVGRGVGAPGRMSPITAVAFLLLGFGLVAAFRDRARWSQCAAGCSLVLAFAGLAGWLYGEPALLRVPWASLIAPISTATLMVLSLGCLLARPEDGLAAVILGRGMVGVVARRFLPGAALVALLFPLVDMAGEEAGIWNDAFGRGVSTVAKVAVLGGLALWTVSELAREQAARERERERLRALLEVLPVGVVFCDATMAPTETNAAARALFGGQTPGCRTTPRAWWSETGEPAAPGSWGLAATFADGQARVAEEVEVEGVCGRRTLLSYAAPVRHEGRLLGAVGGFVDITDRKRAERDLLALKASLEEKVSARTAELRAVNRELEAFAYSVSHDLRAPLRAADGFASLLEESAAASLDEEQRRALVRVRLAIRRMAELIDGLLALARAGWSRLDPQELDLATIAREVVAELVAAEPSRRVEIDIPCPLPAVGDPVLLRAVLSNLLGNAWKFTRDRDPARITITLGERGGLPEYTVTDNGVGFEPHGAEHLFQPFHRLHRDFEGTGIGLAIVARIVARHGGEVRATASVGGGASFSFTLGWPGVPPGEEAAEPSSGARAREPVPT